MRVLVCGGRDYNDKARLEFELNCITDPQTGGKFMYEIISGMARGADTLAADYAVVNGMVLHKFPADWDKYGKRAGYLRNKQMLEEGKPDLVVAFPGGKGTAMMIKLAEEAGVKVIKIEGSTEGNG